MFDITAAITDIDFDINNADAYYVFTLHSTNSINKYTVDRFIEDEEVSHIYDGFVRYITEKYPDLQLSDLKLVNGTDLTGYIYTDNITAGDGYPYSVVSNITHQAVSYANAWYKRRNSRLQNHLKINIALQNLQVYYGFSVSSKVNSFDPYTKTIAQDDIARLQQLFSGNNKYTRDSVLTSKTLGLASTKEEDNSSYNTMTFYIKPSQILGDEVPDNEKHMSDNIMFEDAAQKFAKIFEEVQPKQKSTKSSDGKRHYIPNEYDVDTSGNVKKQIANHLDNKYTSKLEYWYSSFAENLDKLSESIMTDRMFPQSKKERDEEGNIKEDSLITFADVLTEYFDTIKTVNNNLNQLKSEKNTLTDQDTLNLIQNTQELIYGSYNDNTKQWQANLGSLYDKTSKLINYYEQDIWPIISHRDIINNRYVNAYIKTYVKSRPGYKASEVEDPEAYKNLRKKILRKLYGDSTPQEYVTEHIESVLHKVLGSPVNTSSPTYSYSLPDRNDDFYKNLFNDPTRLDRLYDDAMLTTKKHNIKKRLDKEKGQEYIEKAKLILNNPKFSEDDKNKELMKLDEALDKKYKELLEQEFDAATKEHERMFNYKVGAASFTKLLIVAAVSEISNIITISELAEGMVNNEISVFWKPYLYFKEQGFNVINEKITSIYNKFKANNPNIFIEDQLKQAFEKEYGFNLNNNIFNLPESSKVKDRAKIDEGGDAFKESSDKNVVTLVANYIKELDKILSYRLLVTPPKSLINYDIDTLRNKDTYRRFITDKETYTNNIFDTERSITAQLEGKTGGEQLKNQLDNIMDTLMSVLDDPTELRRIKEEYEQQNKKVNPEKVIQEKLRVITNLYTKLDTEIMLAKKTLYEIEHKAKPLIKKLDLFLEENAQAINTGKK